MAKTIVILGGSYAGVHIAHYLLKQKIPDVKVIVVSKSSHFYWNMASVRAIIPGQITDETLFQPLSAFFDRYPGESVEIITGTADRVDTDAKTVLVSVPSSSSRTLNYDQLVVATGARSSSPAVPWKILGSYDETVSNLDSTRGRVQAANHILVAGAGDTGVEVAGELGYEFGKTKEIILLSGGSTLLGGDSLGPVAKTELEKLNVTVRLEAKVEGSKVLPDGRTEVTLKGGETIMTDLYLPTMGQQPNSEMIDSKFLNEKGHVVIDAEYRVKGLEEQGVWALGDVVSTPKATWFITSKQAAGVAKNLQLVLQEKPPTAVKLVPLDIAMVTVGRGRGCGRIGSIKAPSLMVYLMKGKTLGVQRIPGYVDGSVA